MNGAVQLATASALFACAAVTGCAVGTAKPVPVTGPPLLDPAIAQQVADDLASGRRTRADVAARLGDAIVVGFDSGYEVWVYRLAEAADAKQRARRANRAQTRDSAGELVILVAPSGEVVKARTRLDPTTDQGSRAN